MRELAPGKSFGRFRLEQLLGKGGYAEVWLAVEEGALGFKKRLALKVLKDIGQDLEAFDSLINEARVTGHLNHPNIVDVYGVEKEGDSWFIAMEYIQGVTLQYLLKRLRAAKLKVPHTALLEVGIQMARGLHYAHNARDTEDQELRIVHRDLKPANVMIDSAGTVKLADFGIAKATSNIGHTVTGVMKGTPAYIAPEIWAGRREYLPRVDLFALGAILWELSMGELLLQGELATVAGRALYGSAEEDAEEMEDAFPALAPLVLDLLRREPEARVQTAWEVVERLQDLRERLPGPGGLELLVQLLRAPAREGEPDASMSGLGIVRIPETDDPQWSPLIEAHRAGLHELVGVFGAPDASSWDLGGAPSAEEIGAAAVELLSEGSTEALEAGRAGVLLRDGAGSRSRTPFDDRLLRASLLFVALLVGGAAVKVLITEEQTVLPPSVATLDRSSPSPAPSAGSSTLPTPTPEPRSLDGVRDPEPQALTPVAPAPRSTPRAAVQIARVVAARSEAPVDPPSGPAGSGSDGVAGDPEATGALAPGCVVFQSSPPGADVWIDEQPVGLLALSGSAAREQLSPGSVRVSMGFSGEPLIGATVVIESARQSVVRCNLLGTVKCTVSSSSSPCE